MRVSVACVCYCQTQLDEALGYCSREGAGRATPVRVGVTARRSSMRPWETAHVRKRHTRAYVCASRFSRVRLFAILWTVTHQGYSNPLSKGFSRLAYWSGLPCPPPATFIEKGNRRMVPRAGGGFWAWAIHMKRLRWQVLCCVLTTINKHFLKKNVPQI